jgi:hypothetical protein
MRNLDTLQSHSYRPVYLNRTEVDLFIHSGSLADPIAKWLITVSSKPSSINIQRLVKLS